MARLQTRPWVNRVHSLPLDSLAALSATADAVKDGRDIGGVVERRTQRLLMVYQRVVQRLV
jgi:hypothetical protein